MSTVLVTRPHPEGEELCHLLENQGIKAEHMPLITFVKGVDSDNLSSLLFKADMVIAVSKPAVEWANVALNQSAGRWPVRPLYLAVGQKTADKLSKYTEQPVNYPDISDSEHFVQLPQLQEVKNKRIVILRGNGGRELIHSQLLSKGAIVDYCEVYQRQKCIFDGHSKVADWKESGVELIVVTSAEQLLHLKESIPNEDERWFSTRKFLVPSTRISDIAFKLGLSNVKVTGSASNPDLLATIESLSTTGHKHDKEE